MIARPVTSPINQSPRLSSIGIANTMPALTRANCHVSIRVPLREERQALAHATWKAVPPHLYRSSHVFHLRIELRVRVIARAHPDGATRNEIP